MIQLLDRAGADHSGGKSVGIGFEEGRQAHLTDPYLSSSNTFGQFGSSPIVANLEINFPSLETPSVPTVV